MNYPFNFLYRDLLIAIFEKLDFQAQTNLKQSCHDFYMNLKVTNLYDLPFKYKPKLTDSILSSTQFQNITKLNLSYNENVTDEGIKNLTNITKLNLSHNENVTDERIKNLTNLRKLNLSFDHN